MNSRRHGITFVDLCIVLFACLALAQIAYAGNSFKIDESTDLNFFKLQSTVMEVHPKNNYLIVGEKFIELVDFRNGRKRFRTMLRNSSGGKTSLRSFKRGQKVFIRGFELPDGTIKAREIYQLAENIRTRNDLLKCSFFGKVPVWEPAMVK
ncbi:MAG: hypothetical protein U9R20_00075 [Thermodesulfobacteriota bacterium]|nr:hypothetical protein [Thermodesulfobacteriota bacterium]